MFLNAVISEWGTLSWNSGCGLAFGDHLLLIGKWNVEATLKADHRPRRKVTMPNLVAILDIISSYNGRAMLRKHKLLDECKCVNQALLENSYESTTPKPSKWSVRPYTHVGALANLNIGNMGGNPVWRLN